MRNMKFKLSFLSAIVTTTLAAGLLLAGQAPKTEAAVEQIINKIIQNEARMPDRLAAFHPLMETYIQNLDRDDEVSFRPKSDKYFLEKLDLTKPSKSRSLLGEPGFTKVFTKTIAQFYSVEFIPSGFAQMLYIDKGLDRAKYTFEYVRREFLGDIRTVVFDVQPIPRSGGNFSGRIWAEDKDYNIVRFNGTYGPGSGNKLFFHFDSWRENMGPNVWFPAYVYTEESNLDYLLGQRKLRFKGQTRIWGYNIVKSSREDELTNLVVESDQVRDQADEVLSSSPVRSLREWERQAEENVIQRLEKAALLAPAGEVDKVLETVLTNLEITNNLEIQPEVHARVLLTSPLESFTIGHTIVVSRGLIDVLPDEASLAMILSHELAHIALGHRLDTKYAFGDRMLVRDEVVFQSLAVKRDEQEEIEADRKAAEYLRNSPYNEKLANAGLFLRAVDERARVLNHLLMPHIGNTMVKKSKVRRMVDLMQTAPQLEPSKVGQIAALPLGGRVKVDPWTGRIELVKSKPVALLSAREKMPFEVTPVFLYLTRQDGTQTASTKNDN